MLHHIRGRDIPGWNKPWNEAWICGACHDEIHADVVIVEGWVMTTDGNILVWRRAGEPQDCMEAVKPPLYSVGASEPS
jgi:hypothetical protein